MAERGGVVQRKPSERGARLRASTFDGVLDRLVADGWSRSAEVRA
ncbi:MULTISPECIES: hypothetical protein [Amycolatopsis]